MMYNMTSKDKPPPSWGVVVRHYAKRGGPLSWVFGILLLIVLYLLYEQMASRPGASLDSEERNGQILKDHLDVQPGPDLAVENVPDLPRHDPPVDNGFRDPEKEEENGDRKGASDEDQNQGDGDKKQRKVVHILDSDIQQLDAVGDGPGKSEFIDKVKAAFKDNKVNVRQEIPKVFNVHNHDLDEVDEDYIIAQQHNKDPNALPVIPKFDPNRHIHGALPEGEVFYPSQKLFPIAQILSPKVENCPPEDTTFVLIIVVTTANQTRHRSSIRRTWGNLSNFKDVALRSKMSWWVLFSMGSMQVADEAIREEAKTHGDIIQGDFPDHPTEETRKSMQALKWASEHLPSTCRPMFLLKTECSVFVNTPLLVHWIGEHYSQSLATYAGKLIRDDVPIRDLRSSLYVPEGDYIRDVFPSFIKGPSYLLSMDVATTMASLFRQVTPIAMEDAYIGLLAEKMDQAPENVDKFQLTARPQNLCHYMEMMFIQTGKATVHHQVFRVVNHQEEKCTGPRDL